jgi:hypothetical protein
VKTAKRVLIVGVVFWWLGCFAVFVSGFLALWIPLPSRLELPWFHVDDFVETADGVVFIDLPFHYRIGCFDRSGSLIAYYTPPLFRKDRALAAGKNGLLYYRAKNHVYTCNSEWQVLDHTEVEDLVNRTWELAEDGRPRFAPHRSHESPHDRLVANGEVLFSDADGTVLRRDMFLCSDGATLWRSGFSVERESPGRQFVAVYGPPWYTVPFGPWGFGLTWVIIGIAVLVQGRRGSRLPLLVIYADGSLQFQGERVSLDELSDRLRYLESTPSDKVAPCVRVDRQYNVNSPPAEAVAALERVVESRCYIHMVDGASRKTRKS